MNVVDKVMVWLGFERCDQPATPDHEGKVLYKKRGVDVFPHRDYQSASLQGEAAARAHIELTLFDKAVLWIFEKIVSPLMKPLTLDSTVTVVAADLADPSNSNATIGSFSEKKRVAEEEFSNQKKIIKTFLDNEFWPSSGTVFSDDVRNIATAHWDAFEKLREKSGVSDEDRLTYAAAAFVLGKAAPSFQSVKEAVPDVPLIDEDLKVEIETSAEEKNTQKKSGGKILFDAFHTWDSEKKSVDFLSEGSVYMQEDCLNFAKKIVNDSMAIEFGGKTEFTKEMLKSANLLLKLKRQLEAGEQKRIKEEKALEEKSIIEQEKSSMEEGEWDFNEFLIDFKDHKINDRKFVLYGERKYRTNAELLQFSEKVASDENETTLRREAATYLIRWSRYPDHAEKTAREADTFFEVSVPPPPAAPPPRKIRAPGIEPAPVPPEKTAIIGLVNADSRHQEQLRGFISLSRSQMRSGLAVLARIWQPEASSSGKDQDSARPQWQTATAEYETYTDLEEIDNAIKLVEAIAGMKTGHDFELSADIGNIRELRETILQNLGRQRSKIIQDRKISSVADLAEHQIIAGQQRFEDFRNTFVSSSKRGAIAEMVIRDIYFSDECVSYADYLRASFPEAANLVEKDKDSLAAAGYLLEKYKQLKSPANIEGAV